MKAELVIQELVARSKKSMRSISCASGMSPNFVYLSTKRKSIPHAETLAKIARSYGYRLVIVPATWTPPKNAIVIDPAE